MDIKDTFIGKQIDQVKQIKLICNDVIVHADDDLRREILKIRQLTKKVIERLEKK